MLFFCGYKVMSKKVACKIFSRKNLNISDHCINHNQTKSKLLFSHQHCTSYLFLQILHLAKVTINRCVIRLKKVGKGFHDVFYLIKNNYVEKPQFLTINLQRRITVQDNWSQQYKKNCMGKNCHLNNFLLCIVSQIDLRGKSSHWKKSFQSFPKSLLWWLR